MGRRRGDAGGSVCVQAATCLLYLAALFSRVKELLLFIMDGCGTARQQRATLHCCASGSMHMLRQYVRQVTPCSSDPLELPPLLAHAFACCRCCAHHAQSQPTSKPQKMAHHNGSSSHGSKPPAAAAVAVAASAHTSKTARAKARARATAAAGATAVAATVQATGRRPRVAAGSLHTYGIRRGTGARAAAAGASRRSSRMAALPGRMVAVLLSTTSAEHLSGTAEAVACMRDLRLCGVGLQWCICSAAQHCATRLGVGLMNGRGAGSCMWQHNVLVTSWRCWCSLRDVCCCCYSCCALRAVVSGCLEAQRGFGKGMGRVRAI